MERETQLQTRLDISRAKEERLVRTLRDTRDRYNQASEQLTKALERINELEKEVDELRIGNIELNNKNIHLSRENTNSIKKEEYGKMKEKMERLENELVSTRAGMISYKNMVAVVAEQVKNLKLNQERKKDEHQNLLESLREMQSETKDKERIGKLYFIIMLSRWQEASVNKKYDAVCQMTKKLEGDVLALEMTNEQLETKNKEKEQTIQDLVLKAEKMQQQLNNYKGVYQKTTEFDEKIRVIAELTDEKSDLEIELLNMRANLRRAQENEEATRIKMNDVKQLEEDLKGQFDN